MQHGDIEDANLDNIGNFINTMVGAGIIIPDEKLEDYVRRAGNLPAKEEGEGVYSAEERTEIANESNPNSNKYGPMKQNSPEKAQNGSNSRPNPAKGKKADEEEEDDEEADVRARGLL
jgi:hypothetical protein